MWSKRNIVTLILSLLLMGLWAPAEVRVEELLRIGCVEGNPRNSEGDVIELKDGRLCLVYTRFTGGGEDHNPADLAMRTSSDGGQTWSEDRILVPNEGGQNVMSASLRRLKSGELLLFYLRKDTPLYDCNLFVRRSTDELTTLSEAVRVTTLDGYHVTNNDRVIQLSTGRLIAPAVMHTEFDEQGQKVVKGPVHEADYSKFINQGIPFVYYSDDDGRSWKKDNTYIAPASERKLTLQENGVVELQDGRIWMYMRTAHGFQYGCYSSDGGLSWSEPKPTSLAAPCSPATIERIPWNGHLLCVWNDHSGDHPFTPGQRTPLCVAVSTDEGQTWSKSYVLENKPAQYCYISMSFIKDRVLLSYYTGMAAEQMKVVALSKDWLETHFFAKPPDPKQVDVFRAGQDNVNTYRIPGAIVTKKGTVLAFCEARKKSCVDQTPTDMVMKRSFDNGTTWGPMQVVVPGKGDEAIMNPCPVIDKDDGTIHFFCNLFPDAHSQNIPGAVRQLWLQSTDDGVTWSEPVDISEQVSDTKTWASLCCGPGVAIQTTSGRIVVPMWHYEQGGGEMDYFNNIFYSDDKGKSWDRGDFVAGFGDENQVVELADGSLMQNIRYCRGAEGRKVAVSNDGGLTWLEPYMDETLITPCCQASFLRYTKKIERFGRNRILFSNPASTSQRLNLTVQLSYDEGKTWPIARTVYAGPSAYSCLTILPDGEIGVLYETGEKQPHESIAFARFSLKWLTNGKDWLNEKVLPVPADQAQ